MSTNNYFRCGYETFFFDANSAISIRSAWNEAIKYAALGLESDQPLSVSVFKPFSLPGPWQGCDVIGLASVGRLWDIGGATYAQLQTIRAIVDAAWRQAS